ncbi:MAG: hypothetical protein ABS54_02950, partial [Hyphomicrobium sp. SCN 65-11]
ALVAAGPALAQEWVPMRSARLQALDKVTARISPLNAGLNTSETFGALKVVARACYSRGPTEPPKTSAFVEIDEVMLDGSTRRIFTGWMFAESPGLNALEHPVFDLWLTECANPARTAAVPRSGAPAAAGQAPQGEADTQFRRRVRR